MDAVGMERMAQETEVTITRIGYASYGVARMSDPRSLRAKAPLASVPADKWIPLKHKNDAKLRAFLL